MAKAKGVIKCVDCVNAVDAQEIQALDAFAIAELRIPSLTLMENAGRAVCREIIHRIAKKRNPFVCVLCGLGNNAGDGFVIARRLVEKGIAVHGYLLGKVKDLKSDAAVNYQVLTKSGHSPREIRGINKLLVADIVKADVVVDAIFGVGLNRAITGLFKKVIVVLNAQHKFVVAVDVPSGLDATTGEIHGVGIKASLTVTFSFSKKGFLINKGPRYVGQVKVVDIGIPKGLLKRIRKN